MSLLIFRRFQNRAAICSKPCFCDRSKEAVLVSGLRLPGKCFPKVLLGQCSCILESDSLSTFVAITSLAGKIIPYICTICNISRECVYLRRRRNIVGEATSFVRSRTLFAEGNIVLCPQAYNDVLASLEMMLTASGQTMLCPADTNTKKKTLPKRKCFFLGPTPKMEPV